MLATLHLLVERLIGSVRRECTDHLIVLNAGLITRCELVSLRKDAPSTRPIERFGDIVAHPILGGLHHRYARI